MEPYTSLRNLTLMAYASLVGCVANAPEVETPFIQRPEQGIMAEWNEKICPQITRATPSYNVFPSDELKVHRSNTNFPLICMSLAEGERTLMNRALEDIYEDAWIVYKDIKDGKTYWLNCGRNEHINEFGNVRFSWYVDMIVDYLKSKNVDSVTFVHFHPISNIFNRILKEERKLAERRKSPKTQEEFRNFVINAFVRLQYNDLIPSSLDFSADARLSNEVAFLGIQTTSEIITPNSVVVYSVPYGDKWKAKKLGIERGREYIRNQWRWAVGNAQSKQARITALTRSKKAGGPGFILEEEIRRNMPGSNMPNGIVTAEDISPDEIVRSYKKWKKAA